MGTSAEHISVRGHRAISAWKPAPNLILLQRTMVVVEGVARSLNPNINIWEIARPIVSDYIAKAIGPKAAIQ